MSFFTTGVVTSFNSSRSSRLKEVFSIVKYYKCYMRGFLVATLEKRTFKQLHEFSTGLANGRTCRLVAKHALHVPVGNQQHQSREVICAP